MVISSIAGLAPRGLEDEPEYTRPATAAGSASGRAGASPRVGVRSATVADGVDPASVGRVHRAISAGEARAR